MMPSNEDIPEPTAVAVVSEHEDEETSEEFLAEPVMISMQSMEDRDNDNVDDEQERKKVMYGAWAVGSLTGCLLCGPHMACLLGTGAAIGTYRPTAAGDVARAMGRFALSAVRCSRRKASEIDTTYQLSEKAQVLSEMAQETQVWESTKAMTEHPVAQKTKALAITGWEGVKQVNEGILKVERDYRITERSWNGIEASLDKMNTVVIGHAPTAYPHNVHKASSSEHSNNTTTDFSASESDSDEEVASSDNGGVPSSRRGGYAVVGAH